jgi:hypothetical protein
MKTKIIIGLIGIVLCAAFFTVIHSVEKQQTTIVDVNKSGTTIESLKEQYGKGTAFETLLAKENFGQFQELRVNYIKDNAQILNDTDYYYQDAAVIDEITQILQSHEYYAPHAGLSDDASSIWAISLVANDGKNLSVEAVYPAENNDLIEIWFSAYDHGNLSSSETMRRWGDTTFYADKELAEQVIACLQKNTGEMSLEQAKQEINSTQDVLPLTSFLNKKHTQRQNDITGGFGDGCTVYIQKLSDYDGYLELYALKLERSTAVEDIDGNLITEGLFEEYRYIFKIDLYGNDGVLQEELYSNTDRYYKDND